MRYFIKKTIGEEGKTATRCSTDGAIGRRRNYLGFPGVLRDCVMTFGPYHGRSSNQDEEATQVRSRMGAVEYTLDCDLPDARLARSVRIQIDG